ncbi:hypothetical protein ID866_11855 [Astraeus odoratus]|nr:hypothetical protein ID866_11855 [Astraeus odoratus]
MAILQKKVKEDHMAERTAERRQKCEEEEQREAKQKKEEEKKVQRAEETKQRVEEAVRAAEVQRRTAEGQHKLSIVIPVGGSSRRSTSGLSLEARAPCDSWSKAAGGVIQKQRRMKVKEDDEDDSEEDFIVPLALVQEHRDVLGTLTMTFSALLKEFKGYCHDQWDLQAHQVRGLKALQKEMKKANALKAKELEATTKGKEKAAEVLEELSESSNEEKQIKGEGSKDRDRDGDVKMGAAPLASAT